MVAVCVRGVVPPVVAVTVTVLVPAGVPGLLGVLLPPPQAGIHRVESARTAIRLNRRTPRRVRFSLPADDDESQESPEAATRRRFRRDGQRGFCATSPREPWSRWSGSRWWRRQRRRCKSLPKAASGATVGQCLAEAAEWRDGQCRHPALSGSGDGNGGGTGA